MKIRTLIVDDEPLGRQKLRQFLDRDADVVVVGECGDGAEAVAFLRQQPCDLLFLDIQMPRLDGLGLVKALGPNRQPVIIFVTAYDRYAIDAFELQALDYLLKPFDRQRFVRALARAKEQLQRQHNARAGEQLLSRLQGVLPGPAFLERVVVKSPDRVFFLKTAEIDWIEAAGNYLRLHVGTEIHLLRDTLQHLESRLDPSRFRRIHRSTIVNIDQVREFQPLFHGDYVVILRDGTQLPLGPTYRSRLPELFGEANGAAEKE